MESNKQVSEDKWMEMVELKKEEMANILDGLSYSDCEFILREMLSSIRGMSTFCVQKKES